MGMDCRCCVGSCAFVTLRKIWTGEQAVGSNFCWCTYVGEVGTGGGGTVEEVEDEEDVYISG